MSRFFAQICGIVIGVAGCGGVTPTTSRPAPQTPRERAAKRTAQQLIACRAGEMTTCTTLCDRLDPNACFFVGERLFETDSVRAIAAFRRACSKDHADACYQVGALHLDGRGVEKNENLAVFLLKKACAGKSADGCAAMGDLHSRPSGDWSNPDKAYASYSRACELGNRRACGIKAEMKSKARMTNRSAPTISAAGVRFTDLSCYVQTDGAFALSGVLEAVAAVGRCGVGRDVLLEWEWDDAKVTAEKVTAPPGGPGVAVRPLDYGPSSCLSRALRASRPPRSGRCKGVLTH